MRSLLSIAYIVYNVDNTRNHHEARKLEICWDESGYLALLLINGYPHAVFDFGPFDRL